MAILKESSSIMHIDDADLDLYIDFISNLYNMQCTAKLDGSNLRFGLDESGKFYTSRESKSGGIASKKYSADDYDISTGAGVTFRNAHIVLEKCIDIITQCLSYDSAIDVEVLFGRQPNVIVYGKNNKSYVCLIKPIKIDKKSYDEFKKLERLLAGKQLQIEELNLISNDGITTEQISKTGDWEIGTADYVDMASVKNDEGLNTLIVNLIDFAGIENNHAAAVLNKKITNKQIVLNMISSYKASERNTMMLIRNSVKLTIDSYKREIKEYIIKNYNNKLIPKYQDPNIPDDEKLGVEGLVFTSSLNKIFKIVDTEVFTAVNKFYYAERYKIYGLIKTLDEDKDISLRGGLFGQMMIELMEYMECKNLALPRSASAYFKSLNSNDKYELVNTLVNNYSHSKHLEYHQFSRDIINIIAKNVIALDDSLDNFMRNYNSYSLQLPSGKVVKYNKAIVDRTLLQYAQCFSKIDMLLNRISKAETMHDVFIAVFNDSINKITNKQ